uniref:Putative tick transposon n=1 Tax=Rhipicephalus microplus TaxID=6941 RepID=A0A6G5AHF2_RHIMP
MGKKLQEKLEGSHVVKIFRYVDDFLVILNCKSSMFHSLATQTIGVFENCLQPLVVTHEMPDNDKLRFLDLNLVFSPQHICWCYEPRAQKPLLPFLLLTAR